MKPSSFSKTSAHTVIDESKSYVMMSDDLEHRLDIDVDREPEGKGITLVLDGRFVTLQFVSIERSDDHGITLCLECSRYVDEMVTILLRDLTIPTTVLQHEFNSQVLKVESGRCYLRLSR